MAKTTWTTFLKQNGGRGYTRKQLQNRYRKINVKKTGGAGQDKCRLYLQTKIRKNMDEFKAGRFVSRAQAIAVSYSQLRKAYPECAAKVASKKYRTKK